MYQKAKLRLQLTCVLFLLPFLLFSQENQKLFLSSYVTDHRGEGIEGAMVYISGNSAEVITDREGMFEISVPSSGYLRVEAPGFHTRFLGAEDIDDNGIVLDENIFHAGENDQVPVPFGSMARRQITGMVSTVNPEQILRYDSRHSVLGALNGRIPGLFQNQNIRGLGGALIVVDGIPRPAIHDLNLEEVESITVLRDVHSRIFYGSQADNGVILVNTRRGIPHKRQLEFSAETGINIPVSYPEYLNSADYMELYNEALRNDGLVERYSQEEITNTRSGANRIKYPDVDYYSSDFLDRFTLSNRITATASGGDDNATYFAQLGWNHNNGLINVGEGANEQWNRFNIRGNIDYQVNNWMSAGLDAMGVFNVYRGPRINDYGQGVNNYWGSTTTMQPNYYPLLIPSSLLTDQDVLGSAIFVDDDKILGGTSEYNYNLYGDLTRNGPLRSLSRTAQVSPSLSFDLNSLVTGLTAKTSLSLDLYNDYQQIQSHEYAVYQPSWESDSEGADSLAVTKIGLDRRVHDPSLVNASYYRRVGLFSYLDYRRIIDQHNINATLLSYLDNVQEPNSIHRQKNLHYGARFNYMFNNRYIAEINAVISGSPRFSDNEKYALSPSFGLAWIISDESFFDVNFINYLKLKTDFGVLKTDMGVADYYLYRTSYLNTGYYGYNYGLNFNIPMQISNYGNPDITWIRRQEFNIGFESVLFEGRMQVEAAFFSGKTQGEIVRRTNNYPSYIGDMIPYENYESYGNRGLEFGADYTMNIGNFGISLAGNISYSVPTALIVEEPVYEWEYRQLEGNASDAMFGYVAIGLFRDSADIANHVPQAFGDVRPGDIKYKDINGDGIIDENDQQIIGNSGSRLYYGLQIRANYGKFEFFALGTGQTGGYSFFNNPYYRVYGDRKYSEVVWGRWTEETSSTATYPRLSSRFNSNNFRNSTYWLQKTNWFRLSAVQVTYNIEFPNVPGIASLGVYLRANNLLTISPVKEIIDLNIGQSPQMRSFHLGLRTSF